LDLKENPLESRQKTIDIEEEEEEEEEEVAMEKDQP